MVVVDRLSKERHFIPCTFTPNALNTAKLFINYVWKLHGLPWSIVSDRGPQFAAELWSAICECLGIRATLSSSYHPETDGETENANAVLEQYLRAFVHYSQDDWTEWLPIADFAHNNAKSETTSISPFFANSGQHPRMEFSSPRPSAPDATTYTRLQRNIGNSFVAKMQEITIFCREAMASAQYAYERKANEHRSPAPAYRVGDKVWLNTQNIHTLRPMKKLDHKYLGPFEIHQVVSSHAYRLVLPSELSAIDNIFHTSLLRPVANDPLPGQHIQPPPPLLLDTDNEPMWEIDGVLDCKRLGRGRSPPKYLVKYTGYPASWQPLEDILSVKDTLIAEFHDAYPEVTQPTPAQWTRAAQNMA